MPRPSDPSPWQTVFFSSFPPTFLAFSDHRAPSMLLLIHRVEYIDIVCHLIPPIITFLCVLSTPSAMAINSTHLPGKQPTQAMEEHTLIISSNSFHMDHAASVPYVLAKTNFSGRVYMTHPTKAIYKWIMQDSVRVQNTHVSASTSTSGTDGYVNQLFNETDILSTLPLIQTISFNTTHSHNGIRITPYPAGHVLGACMYLIEIAGLNILFTGDYSREHDRHLIPASVPQGVQIDCLITESTFGISTHTPLSERETSLVKCITGILARGGRALLPVFAIGQAQNLLLILEDYWARHEQWQRFPIYYASSLARKCMVVYQTYIDAMNSNIRAKFQAAQAQTGSGGGGARGPWDFEFVRSLKSLERFDDVGGCVMLASPGMLQNGVSRSLLERWAPDAKNGVVITGYSVEGTMAKQIMLEPDSIPAVMTGRRPGHAAVLGKRPGMPGGDDKAMIPRRCSVQEISFAAHVDGQENREFIEEVNAPVVILVHGEKHNMNRMKSRLLSLRKFDVYSPQNCEELRIPFRREKVARVVGRLASTVPPPMHSVKEDEEEDGSPDSTPPSDHQDVVMSGVLVQNDFKISLMAPEDLKEYAGLTTTSILCRQKLTLAAAGPDLIRWALEGTFGSVETPASPPGHDGPVVTFSLLGGAARVLCYPSGEVHLEWEANATHDGIADAIMAVLLTLETSPAAARRSAQRPSHTHTPPTSASPSPDPSPLPPRRHPLAALPAAEKLARLFMFLEAQFGEANVRPLERPRGFDPDDDVAQHKEIARLLALGIPVPGIEVRADRLVARVWLEALDVECAQKSFADRVRAVLERACGVVAPIWGAGE